MGIPEVRPVARVSELKEVAAWHRRRADADQHRGDRSYLRLFETIARLYEAVTAIQVGEVGCQRLHTRRRMRAHEEC